MLLPLKARAVEGGSGAYLLGSHDLMAGFLPPPGTYVANEFVVISGSAPLLSIGGIAVVDPNIDASIYKFSATHVFESPVLGGHFAINFQMPVADIELSASPDILGKGLEFSDTVFGLADLVVTPIIGWHQGNWHYSVSMPVFIPSGEYSLAQIKPKQGIYEVISLGKNKWAIDPTFAVTHLDTGTGFEVSGAVGVTFNGRNEATDYQTAPELHLEGTIAQHFPQGLIVGLTGYAYQQLDDDSGEGAENFKKAIDAQSLQARVFGVGPVVSWSGNIGITPITVEAKYMHEFEARRRLESDIMWFTLATAF